MQNEETIERQCLEFISKTNCALIADDEYDEIAACDAFAGAYDLERYPTPKIPKRRPRADLAVGRGGGVFSFHEGGSESCRG